MCEAEILSYKRIKIGYDTIIILSCTSCLEIGYLHKKSNFTQEKPVAPRCWFVKFYLAGQNLYQMHNQEARKNQTSKLFILDVSGSPSYDSV